jgi:hypothetical protein
LVIQKKTNGDISLSLNEDRIVDLIKDTHTSWYTLPEALLNRCCPFHTPITSEAFNWNILQPSRAPITTNTRTTRGFDKEENFTDFSTPPGTKALLDDDADAPLSTYQDTETSSLNFTDFLSVPTNNGTPSEDEFNRTANSLFLDEEPKTPTYDERRAMTRRLQWELERAEKLVDDSLGRISNLEDSLDSLPSSPSSASSSSTSNSSLSPLPLSLEIPKRESQLQAQESPSYDDLSPLPLSLEIPKRESQLQAQESPTDDEASSPSFDPLSPSPFTSSSSPSGSPAQKQSKEDLIDMTAKEYDEVMDLLADSISELQLWTEEANSR